MALPAVFLTMGTFASIVLKKLIAGLLKTLLTEKMVMEMFLYLAEAYASGTKNTFDDDFVKKLRDTVEEEYGGGGK